MSPAKGKTKPLDVLTAEGKTHLTKSEIEARAAREVTMGDGNFTPPPEIKPSVVAMRKWREVTRIYKEANLSVVSSTDNGIIGRYCMLYAEYVDLLKQRARIASLEFPDEDEAELLVTTEAELGIARARRLWRIMEYFTGLDAVTRLDKIINAKAKSLLDVEDRIFLNPAAKVRTLPINTKPPEKDQLSEDGFDV